MNPERTRKAYELYQAALERQPAERAGLLNQADPELRREVESLLKQGGEGLLNRPVWELADFTVTQLAAGTELGPYRIEAPLGAGGMGQVFRAVDTRLGRKVALKTCHEKFSDRFAREARAISSLNYPNICTLHDVGPNYLVMELVDGETLADRLTKGRLPIESVLRYGAQIADALAAAHSRGIIHRDLKPGNMMIAKGGVKVLDFGLAKAPEDETLTRSHMVMGTPAYMAPEQREGKACDARTDIYALGLVLYEMATGKRPPQDQPAPLAELPGPFAHVVGRCLERDPEDRWQSARDLQRELEWAATSRTVTPSLQRRNLVPWAVAAAAIVALTLVAFLHFREKPVAPNAVPELALSIVPPSGRNFSRAGQLYVDRISPDGSTVLYYATDARFHLRRLSSFQDQLMPPFADYGDPFWSPDSKSIAFPTASGLMKIQVPNGAPELVTTSALPGRGGSWGSKGIILFAAQISSSGGVGLYGVPGAGGKAFPLEVPGLKDGRYYKPEFLPGGEDFLFVFSPSDSAEAQLFVATMRDGKVVDPRLLFNNDTAAAFTRAGGGRILFVRNDNLYAQKLDVKARRLIGVPELVQERVESNVVYRNANFSVSNDGTVVWRSGTAVTSQVAVFDRKGNRIGTAGASGPAVRIRLTPDEAHILAQSEAGSWVLESNGPGRTSLGSAWARFWSPDGSSVIGLRGADIVQQSVSGSHEIRPFAALPTSGNNLALHGVSPDGRRILYSDGLSLLSFSLDGDGRSQKVAEQQVDNAAMSPDGAWTVYNAATEAGVYAQLLTSFALRKQIANGGSFAVWRKDGKEILYWYQDRIWSVRVDGVGTQLRFAAPEPLFSASRPLGMLSAARPLAANHDGSKIYFLQSTEEPDSGVIHVRTQAIH